MSAAFAIMAVMLIEGLLIYFSVRFYLAGLFLQETRGKMIAAAYEALEWDNDPDWRIDEFHKVKFWRMVFNVRTFKAKNYWDDLAFLDPYGLDKRDLDDYSSKPND